MRRITGKVLSFVLSVACILAASAFTSYNKVPMTAAAMDYELMESVNGYDYEIWLQNEVGDISYENTDNNGFRFSWGDNIEDTLCMKGKKFEESVNASDFSDYYVSYDADLYFNNNSYFYVYGTIKDSRTQFSIIETWGSWRPPGNYNYIAKTEIDGRTYELYDIIRDQYGCFSETPERAYHDIISICTSAEGMCRKGRHLNNTVNMKEHFRAWEEAGFELGAIDRIMLGVSGYRSGGDISVNYLYMGEERPDIDSSQIKRHTEYLNNKEKFSCDSYSMESGDVRDGLLNNDKAFESEEAVISSAEELNVFLSCCLNEKAANDFAAAYDDDFFNDNVLLLKTFRDTHDGHIVYYYLNKLYYRDGKLNVLFTSVIRAYSQPYGLDILKIELPREDYRDTEVLWENAEELETYTKRVTIIDDITGELIDIPDGTNFSDLFSDSLQETITHCEGNNPYYLCFDHPYMPDIYLNQDKLPDGYAPSLVNPRECRRYSNDSGEITFRVTRIANGDINEDGVCNMADIVVFQKWLLGSKNAYLMNWKAADLCTDNKLDTFDLCLMRKKILEQSAASDVKKYEINAKYIKGSGVSENIAYPAAKLITSAEQLEKQLTSRENSFIYARDSYKEAIGKYTDEWFSDHKLLDVILSEPSGSIEVKVVEFTGSAVTISRSFPEVMTADMAEWHILLELGKDAEISDDFKIETAEEEEKTMRPVILSEK